MSDYTMDEYRIDEPLEPDLDAEPLADESAADFDPRNDPANWVPATEAGGYEHA